MLMDYVRNGFPVAAYEQSQTLTATLFIFRCAIPKETRCLTAKRLRSGMPYLKRCNKFVCLKIRWIQSSTPSALTGSRSDQPGNPFVQLRDDDGNLKIVEEKAR